MWQKGTGCSWLILALQDKGEENEQRHFCVLSAVTFIKTTGRDSQQQTHTLTCTCQIQSVGRQSHQL